MRDFVNSASRIWLVGRSKLCYNADIIDGEVIGRQQNKRIGNGFEFYNEFIDKNLYYVDKTLLIRDLFEKGAKVSLFTRPRRFGKTLVLTMLKTFFERGL